MKRIALMLCLAACGGDIQPKPDPDTTPIDGTPNDKFRHTPQEDGAVTTVVDATDGAAWWALDLDTRQTVDASTQASWDLSFQRFHIRTRGGVNGTGGVVVAVVTDPFESLSTAPASGYREDVADGEDSNSEPDNVFETEGGWYSYDVTTHMLSPRAQTYVIRSDTGRYFKLQMLGYYDEAGSPAMLSFRWKQVEPPVQTPSPEEGHHP